MKPRGGGIRRRHFPLRTVPLVLAICSLALVFSSIAHTLVKSETQRYKHDTLASKSKHLNLNPNHNHNFNFQATQGRDEPATSGSLPCKDCIWDWQGQFVVLTVHVQSRRRLAGLALLRSCEEVGHLEWDPSVAKVKILVDGKDLHVPTGTGAFRVTKEAEGYGCVRQAVSDGIEADAGSAYAFCGNYVQVVRYELESEALAGCRGKHVQVAVDVPIIGPLRKNASGVGNGPSPKLSRKCSRAPPGRPSTSNGVNPGLLGPVVVFDAVFPRHIGGFIQPFGTRICTRLTGEINHHELSVWLRYYVEVHKVDSIVIYDARDASSSSLELSIDRLLNEKVGYVGKSSAGKPQGMSFGSCEVQIVDVRPLRTALNLVLKRGLQTPLMDDCLMSANGTYRWAGFIDVDEFVEIEPSKPSVLGLNLRLPGGLMEWKGQSSRAAQEEHIRESRRLLNSQQTLHEFLEVFQHRKNCDAVSIGPVHFALEICEKRLSLQHTYTQLFAAATYHLDEDTSRRKAFAKEFPNRFLRRALGWEEAVEGRRKLFVNPRKAWMAKSVHQVYPFGKRGTERTHKRCTSSLTRARILHFRGYGNLLGLQSRCMNTPGIVSRNLSTTGVFGCQPLASNGETHHFCDSYLRRPYMKLSSSRDFSYP